MELEDEKNKILTSINITYHENVTSQYSKKKTNLI